MENKQLWDALNTSLEMEKKGYKFYLDASAKAKNSVTKKLFKFLADSEVLHIDSIKKFYNAMKEKGAFPPIGPEVDTEKRMDDMALFSKSISSLKEKIHPVEDEKKAYEFAMKFENDGYKFYENVLKDAKDENLSVFLKFLLKEESKHHDLLDNAYSYITDSENWYLFEEGAFPQG